MSTTTHIIEGETDRTIGTLNPIFACVCGVFLLAYSLPDSVLNLAFGGIPESLVMVIAISTIVVAVAQYFLQKRHRFNELQTSPVDISAVHDLVNEYSKNNDEKGRNVLIKLAAQKIVQGATKGKPSNSCNSPEIDLLHQYVDECAKIYGISGFRLLLVTASQRMEHHFADILLMVSLLIIKLGRVRLKFLTPDTSPKDFYEGMWFEDIDCMETVRQRTRFAAYRIIDAFGIVWDYGSAGRFVSSIKVIAYNLENRFRRKDVTTKSKSEPKNAI